VRVLIRRRQAANWLHVNIGEREAKEIRVLAEYRGFWEQAIKSSRSWCPAFRKSLHFNALTF
jgi:hypothetical protein